MAMDNKQGPEAATCDILKPSPCNHMGCVHNVCIPIVGLQDQCRGALALPGLHHKARVKGAAISHIAS